MVNHTLGPWTYALGDHANPSNGRITAANGELMVLRATMNAKDEANMRLIAAAPDLLVALQELERVESAPHSETVRYLAREQARAAIAKAEGRS